MAIGDLAKDGGSLCCTYQSPGQGTSLGSERWPSSARSRSSTASWCTGQEGPRHSGPRSAQRNTPQSAGLQSERTRSHVHNLSSPRSWSAPERPFPVVPFLAAQWPSLTSCSASSSPDREVLQHLHLEHIKAAGPGLISQYYISRSHLGF